MMTQIRRLVSAPLAARVLALCGAAAVMLGQVPLGAQAQGQTRAAAESAPAVTVAPAINACFTELVFFTGTVVAREELFVMADVEGARIAEVMVEEGDKVTPGQPLAKVVRPPATPGGGPQWNTVAIPAAGVVLRRNARLGGIASAASPEPLFRIARNGEIEVEAEIPEVRLTKVAAGQPARVQAPGVGEVTGKVRFVAPEIDRQTRLGRARISVGTDDRIRFGSTVTGAIETGRSCNVAVPVSALIGRGDETVVQVVRDGRIETRPVRLGLLEGGRAEIREGLAEGETVVARAGSFLRDGDQVRVMDSPDVTSAVGEIRR